MPHQPLYALPPLFGVNGEQMLYLGPQVSRTDIASLAWSKATGQWGPSSFMTVPEYRTRYPRSVIDALGQLYQEYNQAFAPLVEQNREWDTDYQFCRQPNGWPMNGWVQIDMAALSSAFLERAEHLSVATVKELLRRQIFEIENSLAMYQLLERIFSEHRFKKEWRRSLDVLRHQHGRPIALLAVTEEKRVGMMTAEFGKQPNETITDDEVRALTGFDRFFGPDEFLAHLKERGGQCDYLLYVRSSEPIRKLRRPTEVVEHPLLGNPDVRRVIKAMALTHNIDAPDGHADRRINDTKLYLPTLDMGFIAHDEGDFLAKEFSDYLMRGKNPHLFVGERLTAEFAAFLRSQDQDPAAVGTGALKLRAKPAVASYGCYGHAAGTILENSWRGVVRKGLRERGPYALQLEQTLPAIFDRESEVCYTALDRVFFTVVGGTPQYMGGFRSLMPMDTVEAKNGRNHGNEHTVWATLD